MPLPPKAIARLRDFFDWRRWKKKKASQVEALFPSLLFSLLLSESVRKRCSRIRCEWRERRERRVSPAEGKKRKREQEEIKRVSLPSLTLDVDEQKRKKNSDAAVPLCFLLGEEQRCCCCSCSSLTLLERERMLHQRQNGERSSSSAESCSEGQAIAGDERWRRQRKRRQ